MPFFLLDVALCISVLQLRLFFRHIEIKESVAFEWVISLIGRCLCKRGPFWPKMRKNWPKLVFLSDMKTQLNFYGFQRRNKFGTSGLRGSAASDRSLTLLSNSLQTTFSDIENSWSDERCDATNAELSGCNIYKMMSARAWCNTGCSLAVPNLKMQSEDLLEIELVPHQYFWHSLLEVLFLLSPFLYAKRLLTSANSCLHVVTLWHWQS